MNKRDAIRQTYLELPVGSSNRKIAEVTEQRHGFRPRPQDLYAAIGKESTREAEDFSGKGVIEAKAAAKYFESFDQYHRCVVMLNKLTNSQDGSDGRP